MNFSGLSSSGGKLVLVWHFGPNVFLGAHVHRAITENEAFPAKRLHAIQQVRTELALELPGICSVTA